MITVVSGLPRSGTSMMMQMVAAGGIPVLTDRVREADGDNPKGYYELEKAKAIKRDASWMHEAEGRSFKIVSMLLTGLPAGFTYRIIFMRRGMDEILASQRVMLTNLGKDPGPEDSQMRQYFEKHLRELGDWLREQPNMSVLECEYANVVSDPVREAARIQAFLGRDLDMEAMARVVDPNLYRQRRG